MHGLPVRGGAARELSLPLPPARMPLVRAGRPLKRWSYVGIFGPELMLCVGDARVGPVPRRWWAVAQPDGTLRERTTAGRGGVRLEGSRLRVVSGDVRVELALERSGDVEVVSPSGDAFIWTRKQLVRARGRVSLAGRGRDLDAEGLWDDSAGYHDRSTAWRWTAGVGRAAGRRVAWNLVAGVHDAPQASERTIWVDGDPHEVGPVSFVDGLSAVTLQQDRGLEFSQWCAREEDINLLLFRSRYRQPFGTFAGELDDGIRLDEGWGVMEEHDVRW